MKVGRLLALFLAGVMMLSTMSFTVFATGDNSTTGLNGEGTADSPYLIENIAELKWFRDDVNNGNNYSGKTVKLAADIDLNNEEWTPIGSNSKPFNGTFDGGENTVSNLLITGNNSDVGLFGRTNNGEIKSLTVENAKVSGRLDVGVVAGNPYTSKYTNIIVKGHVEVNGMAYVGGVFGKNVYANLTNITVNVDDTSYVNANSVEDGIAYRTYVGGVIGFMGEGNHKVTNVTSNIDVIGSTIDVGGIVGIAHYGNSFINVSCSGDVTIENAGELADAQEIGGIAGVWHNGGADVTFEDCSFTGNISSSYTDGDGNKVTLTKTDFANGGLIGKAYSATGSGEMIIDVAKIGDEKYKSLADALADAAEADGAVTITLLCDVEWETGAAHGSTPFVPADSNAVVTIEGNDFTIIATGAGVGPIRAANDTILTFNNVNFVDKSVSYAEGAWEFTYLEFAGKLKFEDCDFADEIQIDADNGQAPVTNTEFVDCTFESNEPSVYAVWLGNGTVAFTDCYFTGYRGLKIHEDYGSEVDAVTLDACEFDTIEKKPGIAIGDLNADTDITVKNCVMKNVAKGDQGAYLYESDTDVTTFNFVTENNEVKIGETSVYPIAVNGEADYGEFNVAIAKAEDGDTIKIMSDITTDKALNITKSITLDLNGKTLTPAGVNSGDFSNVRVSNGADVKITNGTIDLSNVTKGNHGIFAIGNGSLTFDDTVEIVGSDMTGNIFVLTNGESVLTFDGTKVDISDQIGENGTYFIKGEPDSGVPNVVVDGADIKIANGQGGMNTVNVAVTNSNIVMDGMAQHMFRNVGGSVTDTAVTGSGNEYAIKNGTNVYNQTFNLTLDGETVFDSTTTDLILMADGSSLVIKDGVYSFDPADYLAEGMQGVYDNNTEMWGVTPEYTISFNTNGGSVLDPVTLISGTVIDLSDYVPTRTNYTFKGWYLDEALTEEVTSITLTEDVTVYAEWKKNRAQAGGSVGSTTTYYTLSFETNGGTDVDAVSKVSNTTVDLSKYIPQKEGYSFDGWYTDEELTNKAEEVKMTSNITLYAKWVEGDSEIQDNPNYKPDILSDEHYAYIAGSDDGMVYPEKNLTRAEAAIIFFRLLDEEVRTEGRTKENSFADVNDGDWFNTAVSTLVNLEVLTGRTSETFAPDDPITRAELTTIFARLSEASYNGEDLFTDIEGHWAQEYINIAASINWVNGENGRFRPDDYITRAEAMTLINRALNRQPETADDLVDGMIVWTDNSDENAWYYIAVQEATNSHNYEMKADGVHEKWTELTENPNWAVLEI